MAEEKKVVENATAEEKTVGKKEKKPSLVKRAAKGIVKVVKKAAKPVGQVAEVLVPTGLTILGMGYMLDKVNERQYDRYHPHNEQVLGWSDNLDDTI